MISKTNTEFADKAVKKFLNDWDDDTPKSFGNDFTNEWHVTPEKYAAEVAAKSLEAKNLRLKEVTPAVTANRLHEKLARKEQKKLRAVEQADKRANRILEVAARQATLALQKAADARAKEADPKAFKVFRIARALEEQLLRKDAAKAAATIKLAKAMKEAEALAAAKIEALDSIDHLFRSIWR